MQQTMRCNSLTANLFILFNFQYMQIYLVINCLQYSVMRISLFF